MNFYLLIKKQYAKEELSLLSTGKARNKLKIGKYEKNKKGGLS